MSTNATNSRATAPSVRKQVDKEERETWTEGSAPAAMRRRTTCPPPHSCRHPLPSAELLHRNPLPCAHSLGRQCGEALGCIVVDRHSRSRKAE
eukprot:2936001-Rhodomonas_salina.2